MSAIFLLYAPGQILFTLFAIGDMDGVAIAMKQTQCFATVSNADMMWQPDTAYYRKTAEFKDFVNTHLMEYWQQNGFPQQCQALEDGDFACD